MKTCIIYKTEGGRAIAERIAASLEGTTILPLEEKVALQLSHAWHEFDGIICVMAAGIVVRSIAQLIKDKLTDPCLIVLDQEGRHVISLLSGHLGGGNALALKVAEITGGTAVITTASDVLGKTALDLWAKRNSLSVDSKDKLTRASAKMVNEGSVTIFSTLALDFLPADIVRYDERDTADIVVTINKYMTSNALCCIPRILYIGVGCNRGTGVNDIAESFGELCDAHDINPNAVAGLASVDVKHDEEGILAFAESIGLKPDFFSRDQLNGVKDVSFSAAAMKAVGVQGVAEPAALLAAQADGSEAELIVRKMKWKDVTLAVAERKKNRWE
ncbi:MULTISPECIES: cobalt-precorrin 5A hydrolase [Desulfosediminicola]|uniref:cobalt-precorrin 5A hydrolase n=1 Tax=Desulfosediminicola TaxID=2886823 RepID=UPI00142EE12D|nr:cobalamin biosynthesis protein [Desulfosediminicola ganghwensis]